MKISVSIVVTLVSMILSSYLVQGFVVVTPPTNAALTLNRNNHVLSFHPKDEQASEINNRPHPSLKITKLQHSSMSVEKHAPVSKRRTFVSQVQEKAVNLILSTYEIDRMEYGI